MLECAAGNTDLAGCVPASFSRTIYYINGTYVHAEIFVRANKLGIETAIVIYNSANLDTFFTSDNYIVGSHKLESSVAGNLNTYEVVVEEVTDELMEKISKEEAAERFLLKELGNELKDSDYVVITYYAFILDEYDVLVSMSNDHFSFRKNK